MVTAIPIDINGDQIGPASSFSDHQWSTMSQMKNLRWKQTEEKPKKAIELIAKDKKVSEIQKDLVKGKPIKKKNEK